MSAHHRYMETVEWFAAPMSARFAGAECGRAAAHAVRRDARSHVVRSMTPRSEEVGA